MAMAIFYYVLIPHVQSREQLVILYDCSCQKMADASEKNERMQLCDCQ